MIKINDDNYIKYLKRKNEKALEYVIDNYGALVKAIIKKSLYKCENIQDECIDDVFLAVWYGIDSYDYKRSTFKNWIAGITKFKVIDYQRKYYKILCEKNIDNFEVLNEKSVEDEVFKENIDEQTSELLAPLNLDEREIFLDYYIKGKKVAEMSNDLGIKSTAIYNRLSRARTKLRLQYKKD